MREHTEGTVHKARPEDFRKRDSRVHPAEDMPEGGTADLREYIDTLPEGAQLPGKAVQASAVRVHTPAEQAKAAS